MSDQHLIRAQGYRITKLMAQVSELQTKNEKLVFENETLTGAAKAWRDLVKQVQQNPTLEAEWDRFLSVLAMTAETAYLKENKG